jgi:hypothetical protein
MDTKKAKKRILSVIKPYCQNGVIKKITEDVLLVNIFGPNEWNTLGAAVIGTELEAEFAVDIPNLCACQTFGDLMNVVFSAIRGNGAFVKSDPIPGTALFEAISGNLLRRQFVE